MLDLSSLARSKKVVVPVLNNAFVYCKKQYKVECDDGWHLVEIENNTVLPLEPHYWYETPKDVAYGFTLSNQIVFQNANVAKKKWNLQIAVPLHFNNVETFQAVKAVIWEDRRAYFIEANYADLSVIDIKEAFDSDRPLTGVKGVTPELRSLYLFHHLEREQQRALLAEAQRKEELATVAGRLQHSFARSGAEMIGYSQTGNRLIVDWSYTGSSYRYNTVLDATTFMVIEAGYCMSGDDRRHNITSLVMTAKDYEDQDLTYITRRT